MRNLFLNKDPKTLTTTAFARGGGQTLATSGFQPYNHSKNALLKGFRNSKKAFTLAEVLITLAIIGVVAALTIPSLVTKINDKVVEHQTKVMRGKIVQGLNLLNSQENGLTKSYANSEEFVRALSKYLKMNTICSADNLKDCLGYDKVNYDKDGETKDVELSTITTAKKLQLEDGFLDPAGFVMGDGTPIIVSWNSNCSNSAENATILDPDQPLKAIPTSCFDGLYDINGTRKPNMYGKDVLPFKAAKIGTKCVSEIGGLCLVSAPFIPLKLSKADCELEKSKNYGIQACDEGELRWAGAMKACYNSGGHLPTQGELVEIARNIYANSSIAASGKGYGNFQNNSEWAQALNLIPNFVLWSSEEYVGYSGYYRYFTATYTYYGYGYDYYSDLDSFQAICVGE